MLTGDNRRTAEATAGQFGITRVLAEGLLQDKAIGIRALQAAGRRVAMVGDGINDAPVLARAEVGMALGSGADIARETGHVVLVQCSHHSGGGGSAVPVDAPHRQPALAAFLMAISSLTVTLNTALRRRFVPTLRRIALARPQRADLAPFTGG